MKKLLVLLLTVMCMFSMSACGGKSESGDGVKTIVLGGSGPMTGAAAEYGNAVYYGGLVAVNEINALGGDIQFDYQFLDDAHDAEQAASAYAQLMDKGMQVSLVTTTTTPALTVAPLLNADGIFGITPSASSDDVVAAGDYIYRMCFGDPEQGVAAANYISNNKLASKVAVITNNSDDYSKGITDTFVATCATLGIEVASKTTFTADSNSDFSQQVKDAASAGCDLVFLPMYYTEAYGIIDAANKQGYSPIFFGVDGMDGVLQLDGVVNDLLDGVYLLTPFTAFATDDATVDFVKKYKDLCGIEPNQFAADAYDCVYVIYNALKATGATADMSAQEIGNLLKDYVCTMTYTGLTGENVTWEANGKVSKAPKTYMIKDGAYVSAD